MRLPRENTKHVIYTEKSYMRFKEYLSALSPNLGFSQEWQRGI